MYKNKERKLKKKRKKYILKNFRNNLSQRDHR